MGRNISKFLIIAVAFLASGLADGKTTTAFQQYSKGLELVDKKKFSEALEKFEQAIQSNSAYVSAYVEWARTSVLMGKRKEALEKLNLAMNNLKGKEDREKIARERESLSDVFYTNETFQQYQNGLNYLKLDRSGSAIEALEKALKTEPENLLILSAYARALIAEEKQKEAIQLLEKAFQLNAGRKEIRISLGDLLLSQNPERSLFLVKPVVDSTSPDEEASWVYAKALSALKMNRDAIEFLRNVVDQQPSWILGSFWLGKMYASEYDGSWNARKYLMTFLKRSEPYAALNSPDSNSAESRKWKNIRAEAEEILERVNKSLE
jgi:tetratricopeptide (TPR) repeat protein